MEVWVYFLIAAGCNAHGWGFWKSLTWPVSLGRLIARVADWGA